MGPFSVAHTRFGIAQEAQHDFRSTVPSRRNVFRHEPSILLSNLAIASSEAEVANLEFAVGIDKQVTGLQISVENVGGMDVLEAAEDLIDKGLKVGVREGLAGPNNGCQITFHKLCQEPVSQNE